MSYLLYISSVFFYPHLKRNPQQLCYASTVTFFLLHFFKKRKTLLFISTIFLRFIWIVLSKHFFRYFLNLLLFVVIFHPPFADFFFPDGIFLGRHLWHLFVMRFIKSTFTYDNQNHVHSHHIYSHFQRASPQGLARKSEGTMMTKRNLFMSLKRNVWCQFVYSLHGDLAKIILRLCVTRYGAICI